MSVRWRVLAAVACGSLVLHCALVYDPDALGPGGAESDAGGTDATTRDDGAASDAGTPTDARGDGRGPTGLDDQLSLADLDATACTVSSTGADPKVCGNLRPCRFATAESGRCENCDGGSGRCGGHLDESCTHTWDCDFGFACYRNQCTNQCELGGLECGRPGDCIDVGYAGGVGVCDPSAR